MKIALAGNPNSGKTTLFNALTGATQYVGNWPGVTVEKKEGKLKGHKDVIVQDLPGIYSLSPYTLEEVVTRNYLINDQPDVVINIIDASNLERNLYLTTQLIELNIPVIMVLNMMDVVNKKEDKIDVKKLSEHFGCKVVEISALKGMNLDVLIEQTLEVGKRKTVGKSTFSYTKEVESVLKQLEEICQRRNNAVNLRWFSIKLLENDPKVMEELKITEIEKQEINSLIKDLLTKADDDGESLITNQRYQFISKIIKEVYKKNSKSSVNRSDQIDRIVTNKWLSMPIFIAVIFIVYFLAIKWPGGLLTDFVNDVIFGENGIPGIVSNWLVNINCASWLQSLIVDGIIGGVGAVLGFLPQMMVLFILLAILEDSGYMSRIAFVLDRIFRKFGLSGKSFIPMLVSTGCGVPGIMASRTIENEKDRRMTIITTTFMPCGAKLPIIALITGALFGNAWYMAPLAYFIGIAAVIISGIILKKTKAFVGDPAPFVMELPRYHVPGLKNLGIHVFDRTKSFVVKAGTIIVISTMGVWLLSSFTGRFEYIDTWADAQEISNFDIEAIISNANVSPEFDLEDEESGDSIYAKIEENAAGEKMVFIHVVEDEEEIYKTEFCSYASLMEGIDSAYVEDRKQIRVTIEDNQLLYSYDLGIDNSILAHVGSFLSYLFKPLGFGNWKASVATITGLIAKENVVGTFGVIYGVESVDEEGSQIWNNLSNDFTKSSAMSFLIFNLLCAPCFAAIGAIKREMSSKKWTLFAIFFQCTLAYIVSMIVYQFSKGSFTFGSVIAIILSIGTLYMLIRPDQIVKRRKLKN